MSEQTLILLSEQLLTKCLLDEVPVLVDCIILLCKLGICAALCLVFSEELLQSINVKATCLLIEERSLHKHRVGSLCQNILHLLVSNSQTKLLCLVSDKLCLDIGVPHHILHLIELIFIQIVLTLLHLNNFSVLVYEFLELSDADLVAQHLAYLLMLLSARRLA